MPVDLEQHILVLLRGMKYGARPATVGDLSRQFGVSSQLVRSCISQMVDRGTAEPFMIMVHGVPTLHGLMGQHPAPVAPDTEVVVAPV